MTLSYVPVVMFIVCLINLVCLNPSTLITWRHVTGPRRRKLRRKHQAQKITIIITMEVITTEVITMVTILMMVDRGIVMVSQLSNMATRAKSL